MKILFIQIENSGSIQLYAAQLANALSKTNEVHFLLGKRLKEKDYYGDKLKLHLMNSPLSYFKMFLLSLNPFTYIHIVREVKRINPDVIHTPVPFLWIALAQLFLRKYPSIVTEHDPVAHAGTLFVVKVYMDFSTWLMRKLCDAVIVHGKNLKKIVVNAGVKEDKVKVIPHGEFSFYTKWAQQDVKEEKIILFFGVITEYKGLQYLIEAAPTIFKQIPDAKILIAGSGDVKKYLDMIEDKSRYEVFNDFIPDEKVAQYFQRAAVVALPYTEGTQSGVVPVAYSFGKPVVVTDVGSIPEVVDHGKTGFVIPPRDSQALADAIVTILKDDDLRKKMGQNCYAKITGELSWDNIGKRTLQVYNEAIKSHKSKH